MRKLILIFCLLSLGASAQYSPKYDTVRLKRGGSVYRLLIRNDTLFINSDTILLAGITPPNYWTRISKILKPSESADTVQTYFLKLLGKIAGTSDTLLILEKNVVKYKILPKNTVQALSGTTPTWNAALGINATLTLSGNTTLTLSNLVAGTSGNIRITNAATLYTLTFAGYTNVISPAVYVAANQVQTSGGSKTDCFSWFYDGTKLIWNGTNDYK